jgi:protocatechuate 3,4-dioxygenase beta subunit
MLMKCAAMGSLTLIPSLSLVESIAAWERQERAAKKPTPPNEIGPFYKGQAPGTSHLRAPGDPGLPLGVSGLVFSTNGEALPHSTVEIWQADHLGQYDLKGYRYRATITADDAGKYSFDTVMPGHYPGRVGQHIHYMVKAPGHKPLTTQLYFATDPAFGGDPDHNYRRDPLLHTRELVRPVTIAGDPKEIQALVNFEIVLERQ